MKQLGNLSIVCALRKNVLLQILDGKATVYAGEGVDRKSFHMDWDDDEKINELIRELNFGALSESELDPTA